MTWRWAFSFAVASVVGALLAVFLFERVVNR
jgi:hypothetical protein